MDKITILVVDEQQLFRVGVRQVLSRHPGFEVLECTPSDDILRMIETAAPDIVLLGCRLSAGSGMELGKRIAQYFPNARVIMLSPDPDDEELFEIIKTSAVACVNKNASASELVGTIRKACDGEYPVNDVVMARRSVAHRVLRKFEETAPISEIATETLAAPLTSRETQILGYIANGNTNRQIACALQISEQTIKNHVSATLRKLNANDRAHAVVLAMRHGLISLSCLDPVPGATERQVGSGATLAAETA